MTEERIQIQAFLQSNPPVCLHQWQDNGSIFHKSGVIPFYMADGVRYYSVMKPVGKRPELGEPEFQLCKGTRMFFDAAQWHDMKQPEAKPHMETLAETALREGIEELGLQIPNIKKLYDVGPYNFTSASSGKEKFSWMFACEIEDACAFNALSTIAATTSERGALSLAEFKRQGRPDHAHILWQVDALLEHACA